MYRLIPWEPVVEHTLRVAALGHKLFHNLSLGFLSADPYKLS